MHYCIIVLPEPYINLDNATENMYYNLTDMIDLAVNRYINISDMANLAICRQPHISMWGYFLTAYGIILNIRVKLFNRLLHPANWKGSC